MPQEDSIIKLYAPNIRALNFTKQTVFDLKRETVQ